MNKIKIKIEGTNATDLLTLLLRLGEHYETLDISRVIKDGEYCHMFAFLSQKKENGR